MSAYISTGGGGGGSAPFGYAPAVGHNIEVGRNIKKELHQFTNKQVHDSKLSFIHSNYNTASTTEFPKTTSKNQQSSVTLYCIVFLFGVSHNKYDSQK